MGIGCVKLGLVALIPVGVSVIFYLLIHKTSFGKIAKWKQNIIIGVVFGGIAVMGTEFGVDVAGVVGNVRDAAPLCAGLLFSGPAGIIAGVIGGVERYIAVAWGVGSFTQIACSVATIVAGLYAAALRKFLFENKMPPWIISFFIAIIMEVLHMILVFVTNMDDLNTAMHVIHIVTVPMALASGLAVMLATILLTLLSKQHLVEKNTAKNIPQIIQRWLLVCVLFAYLLTSTFIFFYQNNSYTKETEETLKIEIEDLTKDIETASNENLLKVTKNITREATENNLDRMMKKYDVSEINIVDSEGIITASTNKDFVGYDMKVGDQSRIFECLNKDKKTFVQAYGPISANGTIYRKYAGVARESGYVQVGYDADHFQKQIDDQIKVAAQNRHVGNTGNMLIINSNWEIVSGPKDYVGMKVTKGALHDSLVKDKPRQMIQLEFNDTEYYSMFDKTEGYYVGAGIPEEDVTFKSTSSIYLNTFMEVIVFALLFALIYFLIKRVVLKNLRRVNTQLSEITDGNLDVTVDVRGSSEFASLSDDINMTVDAMKGYIAEAAARLDKELEFAKSIQHSALPSVFPAYPNRNEFDIYATMDTAKEVGGDFYDFYFTHRYMFNFMIADVSGKGIPAALFMMRAKTQLGSLTENDLPVEEVFTLANSHLCEGNEAELFVTAWQGSLDLETGLLKYANAGHNPPIIRHGDGKFEYIKMRPGLVLAGMDGIKYKMQEFQLEPGDIVYIYTDGVTEATDANDELYGEDRLLDLLNSREFEDMKDLCLAVKADVDEFVGEADQFDDITMLALKYNGKEPVPEYRSENVKIEDIPELTAFVEGELEKMDCPMKATIQINIAIDEIYSNIAKFAYEDGTGPATVQIERTEDGDGVMLTFIDDGVPYNPVVKEDPDVELSAEDRKIGGLGIFMVKKSMDSMAYEYRDDQNRLTIIKKF